MKRFFGQLTIILALSALFFVSFHLAMTARYVAEFLAWLVIAIIFGVGAGYAAMQRAS